jgi:hypothetical protein
LLKYRSILSILAIAFILIASVSALSNLIHVTQIHAVKILSSLNGYDDWHHLRYLDKGKISSSGSSQPALKELTIDDVRQHRILLLGGIHEALKKTPDTAFTTTNIQQSEGFKAKLLNETSPETGNISALLRSDQLDTAIAKLSDLKTEVMRIAPSNSNSNNLVFLIDNLIGSLEKQK